MDPRTDLEHFEKCDRLSLESRGGRFIVGARHVCERLVERYGFDGDQALAVLDRMMGVLRDHTPEDWRFTESPTSRFFVSDEETEAKLLGLSYRDSEAGRGLLADIQKHTADLPALLEKMKGLVKIYINDLQNPDVPIVHHIRTAYGRGKGATIGEEKALLAQTREALAHPMPLAIARLASRPNAIVGKDGLLWVRQYMNWMSPEHGGKEYYLFQPLGRKGLNKSRLALFSHTEKGDLHRVAEENPPGPDQTSPLERLKQAIPKDKKIRSESYWKIATVVDARLADLNFKWRYAAEGSRINSAELIEYQILGEIVRAAKQKLHKR